MKHLFAILALIPGLAIGATTVVSRAVVANTNNLIISHTNLTLNGTATVYAVKFHDGTSQTTAGGGSGGGNMEALSNGLIAVGAVASGSVQRAGDTMTGTLTASVRGTNILWGDWRTSVRDVDGHLLSGFSTASGGGQVGLRVVGDPSTGSGLNMEIGPYWSAGTILGGSFARFAASADPVSAGQTLALGYVPTLGTGPAHTSLTIRAISATTAVVWVEAIEGDGAGLTNLSASALSSGTVPAARLSGVNGSGLTNLSASAITPGGVLPALDGSALTNLPVASPSDPSTNIYRTTLSSQTNSVEFAVPSVAGCDTLDIDIFGNVTNAAGYGFIYCQINSNAIGSCYQRIATYATNTDGTVWSASASNEANGILVGYMSSQAGGRIPAHCTVQVHGYTNTSWEKIADARMFGQRGLGMHDMRLQFSSSRIAVTNAVTWARIWCSNGQFLTGTVVRAKVTP